MRDGTLVDSAFGDDEPARRSRVRSRWPARSVSLNALAAAALARAVGVAPGGDRAGAGVVPGPAPHRAEVVAEVGGVTYVDDSKATNPHAAEASLPAYPRVVWLAGGLLKGASVDELVSRGGDRLVGAVLIGHDRREVADALSRHAPDVPVVEVVTGEDAGVRETDESGVTQVTRFRCRLAGRRVMARRRGRARLAAPGDTVLLAPAGASFDQFDGYADRGDPFAAALRALDTRQGSGRGEPVESVPQDARRPTRPPTKARPPTTTRTAKPRTAATPRTRFGAWLGKPMTSFHLIVAVAALLVRLGLIMVLSASGVHSYDEDGSPWAIFAKQVMWTVVGLVAFYVAMRVPVNRCAAWLSPPSRRRSCCWCWCWCRASEPNQTAPAAGSSSRGCPCSRPS